MMPPASSGFTTTTTSTPPRFIIGLDLGQQNDPTALCVLRSQKVTVDCQLEGRSVTRRHEIVQLGRFKLGTPYTDIVDTTRRVITALPATDTVPDIVVDATGTGRPVIDMMRKAGMRPRAVTITSGLQETSGGDFDFGIPKRNLVYKLILAFENKLLKIASGLPDTQPLLDELRNFRMKTTSTGFDSYEHARQSLHDDLVLSTAMAVWWAERGYDGKRQFRMDYMSR